MNHDEYYSRQAEFEKTFERFAEELEAKGLHNLIELAEVYCIDSKAEGHWFSENGTRHTVKERLVESVAQRMTEDELNEWGGFNYEY